MKHWRRRGGRAAVGPALALEDLGETSWLATANDALLAVPGSSSSWYLRVNGGPYVLTNHRDWPWPTEIGDADVSIGDTVQMEVIVHPSELTVESPVVTRVAP